MRTEKIELKHKQLLFSRMKQINIPISEYSFANLYLFRDLHNFELVLDRELFIKGKSYDGFSYLMPTSDISKIDQGYLKSLLTGVDFLFPIPEQWLNAFKLDQFQRSFNAGESDYIYSVKKMATYQGRKLHNKRNLLKQFTTLYKHQAQPLTAERIDDALAILEDWQEQMPDPKEVTDYYPCLEALKMNEELVLCGGIYYVNDQPAGFILGEELGSDTFVLNFAKAKKQFKGIYQYMYNNFAGILPAKYKYFNFEEDLGKEPLKAAKSSYRPDAMLKKYRLSLK
ncbi:DUF2156 domain-containing protein [Candidatus Omnitrophota bacterium]